MRGAPWAGLPCTLGCRARGQTHRPGFKPHAGPADPIPGRQAGPCPAPAPLSPEGPLRARASPSCWQPRLKQVPGLRPSTRRDSFALGPPRTLERRRSPGRGRSSHPGLGFRHGGRWAAPAPGRVCHVWGRLRDLSGPARTAERGSNRRQRGCRNSSLKLETRLLILRVAHFPVQFPRFVTAEGSKPQGALTQASPGAHFLWVV
ncbi:PREDICTED: uncharacterized protein LOC106150301 [Chinchilla lanigera]|uniref:uncharacterized protein LOC106150301 n=1 Tax=Chinchilla lanigera TaxID=34839 RepID=UPI000696520A|nr:PREDICTED: uncharacterized protein LOC106150301 [Chinchilla lanigera]